MVNRRELEDLILIELKNVRGTESALDRRLAGLGAARQEARRKFISSLRELQKRTVKLEQLLQQLDHSRGRVGAMIA